MRAQLTHLDTDSIDLQLGDAPTHAGETEQFVRLRGLERLSGGLEVGGDEPQVRAEFHRACIEALRLVFGTVLLQSEGRARLGSSRVRYRSFENELRLELLFSRLSSARLSVEVGTVQVAANSDFEEAEVRVQGDEGEVSAATCRFGEMSVQLGDVSLKMGSLEAQRLRLGWGAGGFWLNAEQLTCPRLDLQVAGSQSSIFDLKVGELHVQDADWSIRDVSSSALHFATGFPDEVELDAEGKPARSPSNRPSDRRPLFDWKLLDGLGGQLSADVDLALKVPILRRRQALHPLRLDIEQGKLNFRQLERGLSTLESALLDFSVREEDLVLEVGIPFLPTRGLGKPILTFPLTGQELEWAKEHWVRLRTLAHPTALSGDPEPQGEPALEGVSAGEVESGSSALVVREEKSEDGPISLEYVEVRDLDARLSLEAPLEAHLAVVRSLAFEDLRVSGGLAHHDSPERRVGQVSGSLLRAEMDVDDFPLGETLFDLTRVAVEGKSTFELDFLGTKPTALRMKLGRFGAGRVDFGSYAREHTPGAE